MAEKKEKDVDASIDEISGLLGTITSLMSSVSKGVYFITHPKAFNTLYVKPWLIILTPILLIGYGSLLMYAVHIKSWFYFELFLTIGAICFGTSVIFLCVIAFLEWREEAKNVRSSMKKYMDLKGKTPQLDPLPKEVDMICSYYELYDLARARFIHGEAPSMRTAYEQLMREKPEMFNKAMEYLALNVKTKVEENPDSEVKTDGKTE